MVQIKYLNTFALICYILYWQHVNRNQVFQAVLRNCNRSDTRHIILVLIGCCPQLVCAEPFRQSLDKACGQAAALQWWSWLFLLGRCCRCCQISEHLWKSNEASIPVITISAWWVLELTYRLLAVGRSAIHPRAPGERCISGWARLPASEWLSSIPPFSPSGTPRNRCRRSLWRTATCTGEKEEDGVRFLATLL